MNEAEQNLYKQKNAIKDIKKIPFGGRGNGLES